MNPKFAVGKFPTFWNICDITAGLGSTPNHCASVAPYCSTEVVGMIDPRTVRFVTHKDVDDDDLARTIAALDGLGAG